MSHEVETMAYNSVEVPWHGLGKAVPGDLTPEQMLEAAQLDWLVHKIPAFVSIGGKQVALGKSALVRDSDNSILDVVSEDWNPTQNYEAFEFFNDFVVSGDMNMETAGSLHGGKIVWALARVEDSFELFGGDRVEAYLLFTNPHKFGQSIDIRFTPTRVVCNNTLTLALNSKAANQVRVTHRSKFDSEKVKEVLGVSHKKLEAYKETAAFLGRKRYNGQSIIDYFNQMFPVAGEAKNKDISKNAARALELVDTQPGAEYARGSWWQALNAVTYITNHELGRTADTRVASLWYGSSKELNAKALSTAVEFAEAV
ncbi:MAG: DUF932 domain-containing protein [Legionella sp.]|uniref:DUF932 domain-containing protein n=1 Tax=Legionella sp. TaxID=459 RepID=UPI00283CC325|nr:DUF932 domain-containing protein [Legionella sp.]